MLSKSEIHKVGFQCSDLFFPPRTSLPCSWASLPHRAVPSWYTSWPSTPFMDNIWALCLSLPHPIFQSFTVPHSFVEELSLAVTWKLEYLENCRVISTKFYQQTLHSLSFYKTKPFSTYSTLAFACHIELLKILPLNFHIIREWDGLQVWG